MPKTTVTPGCFVHLKTLTYNQKSGHDLVIPQHSTSKVCSKEVTNMKPRDLSLVLKDAPAGEWIALSFDQTRIMGHGETVDDAVRAARLAGEDKPVLLKMPLPNVGIAAHLSQR